jgi:HAD superfamily hydrolase (TIGR01662 family)
MKKPIRVAFFDLGNTLIYDKDSWEKLYQQADSALWESLRSSGVKSKPTGIYSGHKTLFHYYYDLREPELDEPGIVNVFRELLKDHNILVPEEKLHQAILAMYDVTQANWYIEEDAISTLEVLRTQGVRLGIISNGADDENTQALIDKAKIRPYFEFIISSAAFGKRKPHPGIFQAGLDHFKIPPEQAVMIGDTFDADILGGQAIGMNTIWVTRRVRDTATHYETQPDAIVKSLSEIPRLLNVV